MRQRTLQGGLHLHGAELLDGEVQVRLRFGLRLASLDLGRNLSS
jgi:hypothetical protein